MQDETVAASAATEQLSLAPAAAAAAAAVAAAACATEGLPACECMHAAAKEAADAALEILK